MFQKNPSQATGAIGPRAPEMKKKMKKRDAPAEKTDGIVIYERSPQKYRTLPRSFCPMIFAGQPPNLKIHQRILT
jgi:hypothetical protein